jgi:MFS family permease
MTTLETVNLRSWHRAILVFFSVVGLTGSSLMVRLPEVRDILNVSVGTLGLILVAGAVGAMSGLLYVGRFVAHHGTKRAAIIGMTVWVSTKNSISICSNSRVRKIKFPGVISFRKDFPI